jgi:hypothetical protein
MNMQLIELAAARIGAAIQRVGAKVDFEVLSLPGGSLIAVLFWLCASVDPIRRAATHASSQSYGTRWIARRRHCMAGQAEGRAVARRTQLDCTNCATAR